MSGDRSRYTLDDMLISRREPSKRDSPLATAAMLALIISPCVLTMTAPTIMTYIHTNHPSTYQTIMSYLETR
ncbi:MAG TPA: hypothetical protein VJH22_05700 [Candidatus Nanoarchaeia archaeon]|nr:hypothetical protein [Candidatus Nanoarchaeia archaeon]